MIQLATLGRVDLTMDDAPVRPVLSQPSRLALLAYLAIEGRSGQVRRDSVLCTFWPEATEVNARRRLSQALYYVGRSLGPAIERIGRDHLRVDPVLVRCDSVAFEDAFRAGRFGEAVDLYGGDLLPGLIIDNSNEFDSWLEGQRARLRGMACDAALHLVRSARERGDAAEAGRSARRLVNLAGLDEASVREAVRLLVDIGDRAGAAEILAGFARKLARELEVEPDAETRSLAAELLPAGWTQVAQPAPVSTVAGEDSGEEDPPADDPRQEDPIEEDPPEDDRPEDHPPEGDALEDGPRERGPLESGSPEEGPADAAPHLPLSTDRGRHPRRPGRPLTPVAFALGLTALALSGWWVANRSAAPIDPGTVIAGDDPTILVLPFRTLPNDEAATGIGALLSSLVRSHLAVTPGLSVSVAAVSSPPPEAAHALRFVLEGAVRTVNDGVQVEVELIDPRAGRVIWTGAVRRPASDTFDLDDMAHQIATEVRSRLGREARTRERDGAGGNHVARQLVEKADEARQTAREMRARGLLDVAATGFAEADSILALAKAAAAGWVAPTVARAQVAADVAWLAVLPPAPDTARARIAYEHALEIADHAVQQAPDDAAAREARAMIARRLVDFAVLEEARGVELLRLARDDLRSAVTVRDDRPAAWSMLSDLDHLAGNFAGAYWKAQRAYRLDRYLENIQQVLLRLFATAYEVGDDAAAADWCDEVRRRFPTEPTAAYCALALLAWSDRSGADDIRLAWELIEPFREQDLHRRTVDRFEVMAATVLAGTGMADSAEAVIARVRSRAGDDPDLLHLEARARVLLQQPDSAASLLGAFIEGKPHRRGHLAVSRRFESVAPGLIPD